MKLRPLHELAVRLALLQPVRPFGSSNNNSTTSSTMTLLNAHTSLASNIHAIRLPVPSNVSMRTSTRTHMAARVLPPRPTARNSIRGSFSAAAVEEQQRPQPRMPLVLPARNPDVKATGISAGRPVAPPTVAATSSAVPRPQSKRYSERRGQSIHADTSDDVRSSSGGGGAGGGYGYQQYYGRGSGLGGYAIGYPSGGATVNYGALHPPGQFLFLSRSSSMGSITAETMALAATTKTSSSTAGEAGVIKLATIKVAVTRDLATTNEDNHLRQCKHALWRL
ncbi:hypothetical protein BV898_14085 [Hypsibius exemplaris]|uniref:Uncharacterized protein n=1 Tax=Hypsibius exemplaris TaxID=2072580 RepID=A0A1W0W8Q8_HYPEX|nr:hypothetical protein BV898_14085 [Hypsibius exemplaris]